MGTQIEILITTNGLRIYLFFKHVYIIYSHVQLQLWFMADGQIGLALPHAQRLVEMVWCLGVAHVPTLPRHQPVKTALAIHLRLLLALLG